MKTDTTDPRFAPEKGRKLVVVKGPNTGLCGDCFWVGFAKWEPTKKRVGLKAGTATIWADADEVVAFPK
jgi:hypothetical protein